MASIYATDQREFYADIKEDGGPITLFYAASAQVDTSDPASDLPNPAMWEGSAIAPVEHKTFALIVPDDSTIKPVSLAYIPGLNLPKPIVKGVSFKDSMGTIYNIEAVTEFKPDGKLIVFYLCNLEDNPNGVAYV